VTVAGAAGAAPAAAADPAAAVYLGVTTPGRADDTVRGRGRIAAAPVAEPPGGAGGSRAGGGLACRGAQRGHRNGGGSLKWEGGGRVRHRPRAVSVPA